MSGACAADVKTHPAVASQMMVPRQLARMIQRISGPVYISRASVLWRLTARRHFHEARFKPRKRLDEIGLRRHHLVDVLVRHRHFIEAADKSVTPRSRRNRWATSHVNICFAFVRLIRRPTPCAAELSDAATPFPRTT